MSLGSERLGLALSGGGHRATLYALGALLYIVDAGLNARVDTITSVSGGSFTNAIVGLHGDFRTAQSSEFAALTFRHGRHIAKDADRLALLIGRFLVMAAATATLAWGSTVLSPVLLYPATGTLVGVVMGIRALRRRAVLDRAITRLLQDEAGPRDAGHGRLKITELGPGVQHVICATDLEAGTSAWGRHLYMAAGFVRSNEYGLGDPTRLELATAVRASAAFPGLFPPVRLDADDLNFELPPPRRRLPPGRRLILADGGVHDNLGMSWYRTQGSVDRPTVLVVNSSWAPRFKRLWWPPFIRSLLVLHQSNIAARVDTIEQHLGSTLTAGDPLTLVVSIGDSVVEVAAKARALATRLPQPAAELAERAARLTSLTESGPLAGTDWDAVAGSARQVPTTLFRLRADTVATLLFHGYSSMLAYDVLYLGGAPDREALHPRPWFLAGLGC